MYQPHAQYTTSRDSNAFGRKVYRRNDRPPLIPVRSSLPNTVVSTTKNVGDNDVTVQQVKKVQNGSSASVGISKTIHQDSQFQNRNNLNSVPINNTGYSKFQASLYGQYLKKFTEVGETSATNQTVNKLNQTTQSKVSEDTSSEKKPFGSSQKEKLLIFTGTVEKVIQWNMLLKDQFCYYEIIATIVSLQEGTIKTQKIMLLRDRTGPILQVIYYLLTHIDLEDFYLGKVVRCMGRMIGHNILHAISIRGASIEEVDNLQRLTLISDQAVCLKSLQN